MDNLSSGHTSPTLSMDNPGVLSSSTPRFPPKTHARSASRSPTRPRITDDILSDLSPATTLEAFTSAFGSLKASIETATPTQRAFGIRAAVASKKIHEWVAEISSWPWPTTSSEGFEIPIAKRRKLSNGNGDGYSDITHHGYRQVDQAEEKEEFWGSLHVQDVLRYESRIEEISEDMEDLNVEEIKTQVLDSHVLQRSRPSSAVGYYLETSPFQPYTMMDDLTAVVTATVLQALPNLSRLIRLMDMWSGRLAILREVPLLMSSMEDAEVALRSAWMAIRTQQQAQNSPSVASVLSQQDYEIIRDVLQQKVSVLGQQLDHMLDTLEGRDDTLPEAWLDRMEAIEQDYGEWAVRGERKVREGEWMMEISKRQQEKPDISRPPVADRSSSDSAKDSQTSLDEQDTAVDGKSQSTLQPLGTVAVEAATSTHIPPNEPENHPVPIMESLPNYSGLSLDGVENRNQLPQAPSDAIRGVPDISGVEEVSEGDKHKATLGNPFLKSASSPSPLQGAVTDVLLLGDGLVTRSSSLSEGISDEYISYEVQRELSYLPQTPTTPTDEIRLADRDKVESGSADISKLTPPEPSQYVLTVDLRQGTAGPSSPCRPSTSPASIESVKFATQSEQPNVRLGEVSGTPSSPKLSPFSYPVSNLSHREMRVEASESQSIQRISEPAHVEADFDTATDPITFYHSAMEPETPDKQTTRDIRFQDQPLHITAALPQSGPTESEHAESVKYSASTSEPTSTDLYSSPLTNVCEMKQAEQAIPNTNSPNSNKGHKRELSSISILGYATSEPSPVTEEASPTEYFRPVSSPVICNAESSDLYEIPTPTRTSLNKHRSAWPRETAAEDERDAELSSPNSIQDYQRIPVDSPAVGDSGTKTTAPELREVPFHKRTASDSSAASITRADLSLTETSREGTVSPDISATISERPQSPSIAPMRISSPGDVDGSYSLSTGGDSSILIEDYEEESPSLGRVRLHDDANNYSPVGFPLLDTHSLELRPLKLHKTPSFDPNSFYPESPTPEESPPLSSLEVSHIPTLPSPSKNSDDQLQQQISEILESLPARIRLRSEPEITGNSDMKQIKKRTSLNLFPRPMSRAATPSFTLAPAPAKNTRPRPQNGNPEIKLYHLSRSTGEAPIKLFVRLVGENGERVMVRVGGGWADLGEYLKEYASHHGRRSDQAGKVEIQDLPSRVVSTSSVTSTSTLKHNNGKRSEQSSPISQPSSRPGSSLGRPLSSLAIRKTRISASEEAGEKTLHSPSPPLPYLRSSPSLETPPSAATTRSVSQMSWREEESSLGLAGPRSRKGEISAENAAWVESMKERVRIASAEKEKREKVAAGAGFGELGQVGGTKRLFKKSG